MESGTFPHENVVVQMTQNRAGKGGKMLSACVRYKLFSTKFNCHYFKYFQQKHIVKVKSLLLKMIKSKFSIKKSNKFKFIFFCKYLLNILFHVKQFFLKYQFTFTEIKYKFSKIQPISRSEK